MADKKKVSQHQLARQESPALAHYWSRSVDEIIQELGGSRAGLDEATATERLQRYGRNTLAAERAHSRALRLFLNQFRSPLVLILVFAAVVALIVHDLMDASIVLAIVFITGVLSFVQEYRATTIVRCMELWTWTGRSSLG